MDETKATLMTYGDLEIVWVVTNMIPELGVFELKREALAVRLFVLEHQDVLSFLVDSLGAMPPDYFPALESGQQRSKHANSVVSACS